MTHRRLLGYVFVRLRESEIVRARAHAGANGHARVCEHACVRENVRVPMSMHLHARDCACLVLAHRKLGQKHLPVQ